MPFLSVPGDNPVEIHYERTGSGRPVVLIHGWPLSLRSWEAQVPALVEAGHEVITYDRRGFGDSSQPWSGYDYDTLAADLHALLTELDVRDAVLVGFSMGGGEVARYVSRYGTDRVSAAVFAAAVPPYLHQSDDNPDGGLDDATIEQFENGVRQDRPQFLEGFTRDFMTAGDQVTTSDATLRYLRTIAEFASPKATLDCIAAFGRTDFRDDLNRVTVPTLVIHGDADAVVPFEVSGRRTHDAVPGSTLVVIEGGPHGINASHPTQFNQALLDFLADDAPATGVDARRSAAVGVPDGSTRAGKHEAPDDIPVDAGAPDEASRATGDELAAQASPEDATQAPEQVSAEPGREPVAEQTAEDGAETTDEGVPEPVPATTSTAVDPLQSDSEQLASDPDTTTPMTTDDPDGATDDRLAGLAWRTAEAEDPANQSADPTGQRAQRAGWTADPNLGDVPVDRQPHPGA